MSGDANGRLIVLNPQGVATASQSGARAGLAPRLSRLDGQTLGVIDDGLPGAELYLRGVADLLGAAYPDLQIRYWRKPALSRPSPPALIAEVARACTAVVVGVCG